MLFSLLRDISVKVMLFSQILFRLSSDESKETIQ